MAEDTVDRIRGWADPDLPSKHVRDFSGGGDFHAVGQEFAGRPRSGRFAAQCPRARDRLGYRLNRPAY
jgi:hypothetical protein